jgi:S-DNA-T family DNA segregation ATPase FtsK/SpoIIIE
VAKKKTFKKKRDSNKPKLHSETKKGILAITFFTLAVLSLLSFLNGAGAFGRYFLKLSQLFFGQGFFLIAVSFFLVGLAILIPRFNLSGKKRPNYQTITIGIVLLFLSFLGIFHLLGTGPEGNQLDNELSEAKSLSGGWLGLVIGYPLMKYFGFWASLVILFSLLVISFLITFNLPLIPVRKEKETEKPILAEEIKEREPVLEKKSGFWRKIKGLTEIGRPQKEKTEKRKAHSEEKGDRFLGQSDAPAEKEDLSTIGLTRALSKRKTTGPVLSRTTSDFKLPPLDFLEKDKGQPTSGDIKANINIIRRTLENFGIEVEMAEVNVGPTVTQYTLRPAQGIKLSKITALQNDLALALAAHPLRIEAPIPGRSLVGIEIPNRSIVLVRLRSLLERPTFQESSSRLAFALGRDVAGNPMFADLAQMPHLLVAGATGTGKTIALNNLIVSLLYRNYPEDLKLILIDPKRVELSAYDSICHLIAPIIVQPEKAIGALRWAVSEMERRFGVLQEFGKRDIDSYNAFCQTRREKRQKSQNGSNGENLGKSMPYIVIIIDELADLMASHGREVEGTIVRLAQMARAVGIHLVVSTQRPSVEVITGLIKANITSRMAFQMASQVDSRTVLDMAGAEKLLGNGDMLFLAGNSAKPRRIQGAYVSDKEVRKVADYLKSVRQPDYQEEVTVSSVDVERTAGRSGSYTEAEDELYNDAKEVIIQAGKASASLLQRRLRIGYARAARLLDILEERGVVGPAEGAKPREVFVDEGEKMEIE